MARDQDVRTSRVYDRRTVERNIKKGLISRKDYEKHLKSLDDVADKGVYGVSDTDEPAPAPAPEPTEPPPGSNSQGH
jgi:hypothetical protein